MFYYLLLYLWGYFHQVINFNFYKKKSVENKVSIKLTPPIRGNIYDSKNNLLAGSSSLYEFVVFKYLNKDYFREIKNLDLLIKLDLNFDKIKNRLNHNDYIGFSVKRAKWEQIVVWKNKFKFNSIKLLSLKRYYPYKNFSHVIGYMVNQPKLWTLPKGVFHLKVMKIIKRYPRQRYLMK